MRVCSISVDTDIYRLCKNSQKRRLQNTKFVYLSKYVIDQVIVMNFTVNASRRIATLGSSYQSRVFSIHYIWVQLYNKIHPKVVFGAYH